MSHYLCQNFKNLNVAFWNVAGLKNLFILDTDHSSFLLNYDIVGLVETWNYLEKTNLPFRIKEKYDLVQSFASKNHELGRASGGIIFLIKKELMKYVTIIDIKDEWIFLKLRSSSEKIIVGNVYIKPTIKTSKFIDLFENFFLDNLFDFVDSKLIIGGDFNARIGTKGGLDNCVIEGLPLNAERRSSDLEVNERGRGILPLMSSLGLVVLNGRTYSDSPAHPTFISSKGSSVIDLVWVNEEGLKVTKDLKIIDFSYYSWHCLVSLNLDITFELEKVFREFDIEIVKWEDDRLSDFQLSLSNSPNIYYNNDQVDDLSNNLKFAIKTALMSSGMLKEIKTNNALNHVRSKPWFNEKCKIAKKEAKEKYDIYSANNFDSRARIEYVNTRNSYNALKIKTKKNFDFDLIEKFKNVKKSTDFWQAANFYEKSQKSNYKNEISIPMWENFYQTFYNIKREPFYDPTPNFHPYFDSDITLDELLSAISKLKNKKSPGLDKIPNEALKNLSPAWYAYILNLFNSILRDEKIPMEWLITEIKPMFKKGDPNDPNNYRAIALENTILKLFVQILYDRLYFWVEFCSILPESQAGFRKGRSCNDHIFALNAIVESHLLQNKYLYGIFIDFRKAFDYVSHSKLGYKLSKLGVSAKFIRVINFIYSNAKVKINCLNQHTREIDVTRGVLQGDPLSPLLFSLLITDFEDFFLQKGCKGVKLADDSNVTLLNFADDTMILATSTVDAQDKMNILEEYCSENDLIVNTEKTLIIPFHDGRPKKLKSIYYKKKPIKYEKIANYLGVPFSASRNPNKIANYFKNKASLASYKAIRILSKMKSSNWESKIQLLNSLVKSVLLYGGESWASRCLAEIEKIQLSFFKNLLHLPKNTPGYMIRLETGIRHLKYSVFEMMINYWIKLLQMPNTRLPQKAFKQLMQTIELERPTNWAFQLKELLNSINKGYLIYVENPEEILREKDLLLNEMNQQCKLVDIRRANTSSYNPNYVLTSSFDTEPYLRSNAPFDHIRLFAQIRLSKNDNTYLRLKIGSLKMNRESFCSFCNLPEEETLTHILTKCRKFDDLRLQFLQGNDALDINIQSNILLKNIYFFISNVIKMKNQLLDNQLLEN